MSAAHREPPAKAPLVITHKGSACSVPSGQPDGGKISAALPASKGLASSANLAHGPSMLEKHTVAVSDIRVPLKRKKTLCEDKVQNIAESILENGQITPIQVRPDGEGYVLIEGLHRLEALRLLGEDSVLAYFVRARLH